MSQGSRSDPQPPRERRPFVRWGASLLATTMVIILAAPSSAVAAVRTFTGWSCSSPRLPSVESVAASAPSASPNEITHAITRGDGNFRSRTWTQPDAATFKYRVYSVSTSSALGGWVSAASIESAARTCVR